MKREERAVEIPSQRAQERAEELRASGQQIIYVGETQVVYCSPQDVEKYGEKYRIFNRGQKERT